MQRANEGGETDCKDVGVDWTLVDVAVDVDADVDGKSRLKLTRRQTWPKPGCRRRFPSESARGADTCLLACPALVRQCCSSVSPSAKHHAPRREAGRSTPIPVRRVMASSCAIDRQPVTQVINQSISQTKQNTQCRHMYVKKCIN